MAFNSNVNPKAKTERFKIYIDVGNSDLTPVWELQGRGVESWTVETGGDGVNKKTDVLGYVDMERGTAQPTQSGISLAIRKGSALAEMLFDSWFSGDFSKLDSVKILQKFEIKDGATTGTCLARQQNGCMIEITNFAGEAGGYLNFEITLHYSNDIITGTMPMVDGTPVTFTPDDEEEEEEEDTNL